MGSVAPHPRLGKTRLDAVFRTPSVGPFVFVTRSADKEARHWRRVLMLGLTERWRDANDANEESKAEQPAPQ